MPRASSRSRRRWSGQNACAWASYSEDEQNSHRALAGTIGNGVLEEDLALRAFDRSFPEKQALYARSAVPMMTRRAAELPAWGTAAISQAVEHSRPERFVEVLAAPRRAGDRRRWC